MHNFIGLRARIGRVLGAARRLQSRLPRRRWRVLRDPVPSVLDIPAELPARAAVVVAKGGSEQWLAFDCPCGNGHRVILNLDASDRPSWRISERDRLSVTPSVDEVTLDRRCHYILRKGLVKWV